MNRLVALLAATAVTISVPAAAQEAEGDWAGVLELGPGARLPLVVHIKHDDAGVLIGTLDSPAQGSIGMPLAAIAVTEGRLTFKVPAVTGEYGGTWDEAAKAWQGEWRQAGMSWPLRLAVPPPPPPLPAGWQLPSDAAISELIAERNAPRAGQGIVVGLLGPDGRRIVAGGSGPGAAFDGTTLFEIGSISKVFTALILADMVNKGEVTLDDPAAKYLPSGHRMPERGGRQIALRDLATHRSGLPRMPDNMLTADLVDPFADYTEAPLLAFLDRYQLPRDIGSQWEYSNIGMGLLGYLLARAAGTDYETLLRERITGPLGMDDTVVTLTPDQAARFAQPYDGYMRPAKPWTFPTLMGAGGIRSTAADMIEFAAAVLDPKSPIAPAVTTALSVRVPASNPRVEQALGWLDIHPEPGRDILLHDGGTGGFRSVLAMEPSKGRAVVALINSAAEPGAVDLGMHVLLGSPTAPTPPVPPAPPPPATRIEVTLPVTELERVVGRYELLPNLTLTVERRGEGLVAQLTDQPAFPIFAEAPLTFFWRVVNAQVRFTTNESGKVSGGTFSQDGQTIPIKRLEP